MIIHADIMRISYCLYHFFESKNIEIYRNYLVEKNDYHFFVELFFHKKKNKSNH